MKTSDYLREPAESILGPTIEETMVSTYHVSRLDSRRFVHVGLVMEHAGVPYNVVCSNGAQCRHADAGLLVLFCRRESDRWVGAPCPAGTVVDAEIFNPTDKPVSTTVTLSYTKPPVVVVDKDFPDYARMEPNDDAIQCLKSGFRVDLGEEFNHGFDGIRPPLHHVCAGKPWHGGIDQWCVLLDVFADRDDDTRMVKEVVMGDRAVHRYIALVPFKWFRPTDGGRLGSRPRLPFIVVPPRQTLEVLDENGKPILDGRWVLALSDRVHG